MFEYKIQLIICVVYFIQPSFLIFKGSNNSGPDCTYI